jgi:hypothetical protein
MRARFPSRGAAAGEPAARRVLRLGLGGLWLLDAALQAQPGMFGRALVTQVWAPAALGNPPWLAGLVNWSIAVASPHLAAFNAAIVAVQAATGLALLSGRSRAVAAGAWASALFGLAVWLFGEGLGQLWTGTATVLSGAPGSAALYMAGGVLLLLPEAVWYRPVPAPTAVGAAVLLLGALLQLQAPFWRSVGLSQAFAMAYMMRQPASLRRLVDAASWLASTAPRAVNAGLIALLAAEAVLLWRFPRRGAVVAATVATLALLWLTGQDAGMLFSGMATDPNSAPLLALLVVSGAQPRDSAVGRRGAGARPWPVAAAVRSTATAPGRAR